VEALLRLNRVVHAPYYALFLVGPVAVFLEIWWTERKKAQESRLDHEPAHATAAVL